MKLFLSLLLLLPSFVYAQQHSATAVEEGKYLGSISSEIPAWFKDSFLDLAEDVAEAAENGKRLMIYFHQPGCPYCAKLVDDNFTDPKLKQYVQKNFDAIAINMWGDREILSVGNKTYSEKEFALALKVQYTPTVLFFDEKGKIALRLNGYYPKKSFQHALKFIAERKESEMSFNQYVQASTQYSGNNKIKDESFYIKTNNLKTVIGKEGKATAVFFERPNCTACDDMHELILSDKSTRSVVESLNNIQLDVTSEALLVTPQGKTVSVKQWADQLNVAYHPSVIIFDEQGQEVIRIEAFIKTFHFQSVFAYVAEKAYLTEPSFQRYIAARGERIRAAGYDTDIWGYQSDYNPEAAAVESPNTKQK